MTDYWLSKMMFDLQRNGDAASWRANREPILSQYPLTEEIKQAVRNDDIKSLAPHVNAYLLRFYCGICGMGDAEFISHLQDIKSTEET
ncbi:MAG: hypothetical protein VW226_02070 [Rhodospirillaceae bacterium]